LDVEKMNDLFQADKDIIAIERIKTFCPPEGYYVAFSGGKDSVVIMDLVKRAGVPFDAHYNITGIDPPELYYFIRDEFPEVQRHRPEMTMWKLIEKKGFPPTRMIRYCCEKLKEGGGSERMVLTGIRWAESNRRSHRRMNEACFRDSRKFYFHPIIDWTEEDVWSYIHKRPLKYCKLYDEGFKRLGCIMCPMGGKSQIRDAERWPKYKRLWVRAMQRGIENSVARGRCPSQKDGEEMYEWWISQQRANKADPDKTVIFE
jgi:phosphoadenosine phosphosulfate reductase